MLLDKASAEYGIHKIYSFVFADNEDEIALLENCGLHVEARFEKEAINDKNEYVDIIRMSIFL